MREFPKGGLIGKTVHFGRRVKELNIPIHAANAGYFIVLSVFPVLLLIVSLLGYTGLQVADLMTFLGDFLPESLVDAGEELVFGIWQNTSGALVGVSAVTALWSASRGIYGLLLGMNAIYGVSENRGYFYTRLISLVYTFAFVLVVLLTLVLHVFGNGIVEILSMIDHPLLIFVLDLLDFRFVFLLVVQTLLFTVMFMVLPNRSNGFRESLPGGLFSSLGWLVFSEGYSVYGKVFPGYANVYGSVYTVALSMLWLYCCISLVCYGGALNRYLQQ